ncbi:hypothetical protein [Acidocella sp.]|jgi:hypothetical protein|uniref:hypothetical protein n=1 Tax=Acidocella sp. TaxID=50710 RepID=UPI00262026CD|nr:hypothetical protein [Acidocella sp.]MDD2794627.1 hypothetical protein [Acidocella sp.]
MKINPDKISTWVEGKASAYLEWDKRRTQARFEKALKLKRYFWILLGICCLLFLLGLMDHLNAAAISSACALALIVVFMKFVQLTMIALHGKEGSDE